jgi:hypothetical protein
MTTCSICGHEFTAHRSDARYCSHRCQVAGQRAGNRVHFSETPNETPATSGAVLPGGNPTSEASTRRLSRVAIPDVVACRAPVYAAGSLHGPVYDAKGNLTRADLPAVVGYLGTDGRLERIARR